RASARTVRSPQAMNRLRPMATAGVPGSVAPMTSASPAEIWARYHNEGICAPRCGSLARSGFPDALSVPSTTQLFDPSASEFALPRRNSRTAGWPLERLLARALDQEGAGKVEGAGRTGRAGGAGRVESAGRARDERFARIMSRALRMLNPSLG